MDDFNKFKEERLPSIENFYSKLIYLKFDVLVLADVFENFRKTGKEYYNLDPAHYFSCPGFAWDAMLKMTGINLQLITDVDVPNRRNRFA